MAQCVYFISIRNPRYQRATRYLINPSGWRSERGLSIQPNDILGLVETTNMTELLLTLLAILWLAIIVLVGLVILRLAIPND